MYKRRIAATAMAAQQLCYASYATDAALAAVLALERSACCSAALGQRRCGVTLKARSSQKRASCEPCRYVKHLRLQQSRCCSGVPRNEAASA